MCILLLRASGIMASYAPTMSASGKKLVSTKSGLRILCINDAEKSAFEINEPAWQVDCEVTHFF